MPRPDATAKTALASTAFSAVYLIWADFADGALRFTTYGQDTTVSASGDSELDGTYVAWAGQWLNIGDIDNSDGGSDTLTLTLSGIASIDSSLLNEIGDKSKWQGRACRIWCRLYDEAGASAQGAIFALYTGYMSSVRVVMAPEEQLIEVTLENWRAAFNAASNRTYLNQKDYDSADTSAQATISAANGRRRDSGGADGAFPNSGGYPDTGGWGAGGGGVTNFTPYPDAPSQSLNADFTDTSRA